MQPFVNDLVIQRAVPLPHGIIKIVGFHGISVILATPPTDCTEVLSQRLLPYDIGCCM
jgi:hypothetical protein